MSVLIKIRLRLFIANAVKKKKATKMNVWTFTIVIADCRNCITECYKTGVLSFYVFFGTAIVARMQASLCARSIYWTYVSL